MENNENEMERGLDISEKEEFARFLEEMPVDKVRFEPGEQIETKIIKVTKDWVFIDTGLKSEGYFAVSEVMDENGSVTVAEGDTMKVYFLSGKDNEHLFTTRISGGAARYHLESAFETGIPVEGYVEKEIKGGFEVKVAGSVRAFCPYSQIDMQRNQKAEGYEGKRLSFKITEYAQGGKQVVLSRRTLLEEERRHEIEELKKILKPGQRIRGSVSSIRDFGAFVNMGAVEGMVPISEISWGRVEDISDFLCVDQEVEVSIKNIEWERERITLSIKDTLDDPWEKVDEKYHEGSVLKGRVARLEKFGAFVNLEPGIDGLIHISNLGMGKRINHPRDVLSQGQEIDVRISGIEKDKKRMSLAWATAEAAAVGKVQEDQEVYVKYKEGVKGGSQGSFGTLGDMLKEKFGKDKK